MHGEVCLVIGVCHIWEGGLDLGWFELQCVYRLCRAERWHLTLCISIHLSFWWSG